MSEAKSKSDAPAEGKKSKKLVLIGAVVAVLLAGGGGAAWWFMKPPPDDEVAAETTHTAKKKGPPVFTPLDPFTVNLADAGGERFAQVAVVLEMRDAKTGETLKEVMPAVRNSVLMLLSSKKSEDLLTVAGKESLAAEIGEAVGEHLGWTPPDPAAGDDEAPRKSKRPKPQPAPNPVAAVLFDKFIVQ